MLLRRLVALFSSVTMLHLSVGAADASCVGNGAGSQHSAAAHSLAAASASHGHHQGVAAGITPALVHVDGVAAPPSSRSPGRSPAQARCCESMTTCSVTGTVAQRASIVAAVPCSTVLMPTRTDAVSSAPQAPEPPPPKA